MKTYTITGVTEATAHAAQLIAQSKYFSVTPLPFDVYEFTRKDEA